MRAKRSSNATVGVAVVVAGVAQLVAMGPAVTPLIIALAISYVLWLDQPAKEPNRGLLGTYGAAVLVQCAHFVEEYRTGFYLAFPPILGATPWSAGGFLIFNIAWLAIFVAAGIGIDRSRRPALLVALFLAIGGGIGNGLGHLALAAQRGGYFPGGYTAVLALCAGSALLWKLRRRDSVPGAA